MKNFRIIFGAILVSAMLLCGKGAQAVDWTLPRGDSQLTNSTLEPFDPGLTLAWEHFTSAFPNNPSQPVAVGNSVFFATGNRVYCLDVSTGARRWSYPAEQPMPSQIRTSLAYYQGRIYFGANDGLLYAISASDGRTLWTYATGGPIRSSPMIADGRLYIGSGDRALHCVDAETGEPFWLGGFRTRDDVTSIAAVSSGLVIFVSRDTFVYAANAQTGRLRWSFRLPVPALNIEPVVSGENVYIGAGTLFTALGVRSGVRRWSVTFPAEIAASPAIRDQVLFIPLRNRQMYAMQTNGRVLWSQPVDTVYSTRCSPLVAGNSVIVATDKGLISAFDVETGQLQWRYMVFPATQGDRQLSANNNIVASPIWANGALYVLPDDGGLRSFRPNAPDNTGPEAFYLVPNPGTVVSGSPPLRFSVQLMDAGSGVDASSVVLTLNGTPLEHTYDPSTGIVSYVTPFAETQVPLPDGRHSVQVTATDWKGNTSTTSWSFTVDNSLPRPRVRTVRPAAAPPQQQEDRTNRWDRGRGRGDNGNQGTAQPRHDDPSADMGPPPPPPPPPTPGGPGGFEDGAGTEMGPPM